jgi:hypothetical protein
MSRRKKIISPNSSIYNRTPYYQLPDGKMLESGETIKIVGERGTHFKFIEHVVKLDSGIEWIDCFQIDRGVMCGWRSFKPERIKVIPKKKVKTKNV